MDITNFTCMFFLKINKFHINVLSWKHFCTEKENKPACLWLSCLRSPTETGKKCKSIILYHWVKIYRGRRTPCHKELLQEEQNDSAFFPLLKVSTIVRRKLAHQPIIPHYQSKKSFQSMKVNGIILLR